MVRRGQYIARTECFRRDSGGRCLQKPDVYSPHLCSSPFVLRAVTFHGNSQTPNVLMSTCADMSILSIRVEAD
jgi:hypothetical protein